MTCHQRENYEMRRAAQNPFKVIQNPANRWHSEKISGSRTGTARYPNRKQFQWELFILMVLIHMARSSTSRRRRPRKRGRREDAVGNTPFPRGFRTCSRRPVRAGMGPRRGTAALWHRSLTENDTPQETVQPSRRKPAQSNSVTAKRKSGRNPPATAQTTTVLSTANKTHNSKRDTLGGRLHRCRLPSPQCNCALPVVRERDWEPDVSQDRKRESLAFGAGTKTTSAAPEEEDCEDAGDLALECNRASLLVWERDREPDSGWDQEPLAAGARTITVSAAPEEEDCEASDLALKWSGNGTRNQTVDRNGNQMVDGTGNQMADGTGNHLHLQPGP